MITILRPDDSVEIQRQHLVTMVLGMKRPDLDKVRTSFVQTIGGKASSLTKIPFVQTTGGGKASSLTKIQTAWMLAFRTYPFSRPVVDRYGEKALLMDCVSGVMSNGGMATKPMTCAVLRVFTSGRTAIVYVEDSVLSLFEEDEVPLSFNYMKNNQILGDETNDDAYREMFKMTLARSLANVSWKGLIGNLIQRTPNEILSSRHLTKDMGLQSTEMSKLLADTIANQVLGWGGTAKEKRDVPLGQLLPRCIEDGD